MEEIVHPCTDLDYTLKRDNKREIAKWWDKTMIRGKFDEPIGEGLVRIGALTNQQKEEVLELQKNGDKRLFGQIAIASNYVNVETVNSYLKDIQTQKRRFRLL